MTSGGEVASSIGVLTKGVTQLANSEDPTDSEVTTCSSPILFLFDVQRVKLGKFLNVYNLETGFTRKSLFYNRRE